MPKTVGLVKAASQAPFWPKCLKEVGCPTRRLLLSTLQSTSQSELLVVVVVVVEVVVLVMVVLLVVHKALKGLQGAPLVARKVSSKTPPPPSSAVGCCSYLFVLT